MKYRIQRTDHKKLTQGLLALCMMLPKFYYEPCDCRTECRNLLNSIYQEALKTKFLRRNNWEPLNSAYNIQKTDDRIFIESIFGKPYLEFQIVEVREKGSEE
jgi:hypothetical protein